MTNVEDLERMRKFGAYAERERIKALLQDRMLPDILNRINPKVEDYNRLLQLLVDLIDEANA